MHKALAILAIALGSLFLVGQPAVADTSTTKVTICHRTNADNIPYVKLEVARNAVDGVKAKGSDHYGEHKGPVYSPGLKAQHIKWGDIIPPVAGFHAGLNWTADGQAVYYNGCKPATVTTETTVTTVPQSTETTVTTVPGGDSPPPSIDVPQVIERPAAPLSELPHTGSNDGWLALLAVVFIVTGWVLIIKGASLRR